METQTQAPATFPNVRGFYKKDEKYDYGIIAMGYCKELEVDKEYQVLLLRRDEGYMKRLAECALSIEALAFQGALSKNRPNYNSPLTVDGLNIEIVHLLNLLGRFTGMLVNSTSWRDQELHDYDKMELRCRLEKLMQHLK